MILRSRLEANIKYVVTTSYSAIKMGFLDKIENVSGSNVIKKVLHWRLIASVRRTPSTWAEDVEGRLQVESDEELPVPVAKQPKQVCFHFTQCLQSSCVISTIIISIVMWYWSQMPTVSMGRNFA